MGKREPKEKLDDRYWRLMSRVALNIKKVRKRLGFTQEDMQSKGFERRWYQRLESGNHSISLPTLDRLSRALKVDVSEFFK